MKTTLFLFGLLTAGALACTGGNKGGSSSGGSSSGGSSSGSGNGGNNPGAGNVGGSSGGGPPPPAGSDPLFDKAGVHSGNLIGYGGTECTADQPVSDYAQLTCGFESSESCSWANANGDDFDWLVGAEPVDEAKFQQFFALPPPNPQYLVIAGVGEPAEKSAQFASCPVACSNADVLVTLDHWRTGGADLQVCKRAVGSTDLTDCQTVPAEESPGPSLVSLPAGENFEVVVVASGLTDASGEIVIIDNILTDFQPCDGPPAACEALVCTFDGEDLCNFESTTSGDAELKQDPEVYFGTDVSGRFGPQSTGPRAAAEGTNYAAARVLPGTYAAAESLVETDKDEVLSFEYWESTDGLELRVCYDDFEDDANCPLITDKGVQVSDWAWRHAQVLVPAGTQKVKIIGKNTGNNIGVVGIDDMKLLTLPPSGNPDDAVDPACV